MNKSEELWKKLHEESRYRPKYPSENVVQYVFRNFERNGKTKVLDLGCGAGRHIVFMANENIVPYGVDFSSEGVNYTKERLHEIGKDDYMDNIQVGDLTNIPFEDDMFDGIICYGALYYLTYKDSMIAVSEMKRVLKKNIGKIFLLVRTTEDYRCNKDNVLETDEENTYIINQSSNEKCAYSENGMVMHFFTRAEVEELFKDFQNLQIDKIVETHDNGKYCDSNYIITATKGE
ncbi:MAG: class I SAM-dependent methyltransferase [Clostridiales bacterium]|nr:class I SAM-dependent methyltransferase [Clostridiales bacterium]